MKIDDVELNRPSGGFSALQRAENSSIDAARQRPRVAAVFQCSSASRKFLNCGGIDGVRDRSVFQCSSASRKFLNRKSSRTLIPSAAVSVLFSEPKIPQSSTGAEMNKSTYVSVLFSEPKIPQSSTVRNSRKRFGGFSALQRAENSSIPTLAPASIHISDRDDHASSFLSLPGASP